MKPVAAIVQAAIDVDEIAERIIIALNEERSIDAKMVNLQNRLGQTRLRIGKMLNEVRPAWPERGPKAKGWSQLLVRLGIDDVTAWRYRELAGAVSCNVKETPDQPDRVPTYKELGLDSRPRESDPTDPEGGSEREDPTPSQARQLAERDADDGAELAPPDELAPKPANVNGGSGEVERGTYCTPRHIAQAVGPWDLDPFSNPRSHIIAGETCQLERHDDGLLDLSMPGSYHIWGQGQGQATHETRVWIQPPYDIVEEVIAHYGHTRFCALLRFDTSTAWFRALLPLTSVICFPRDRVEFEAPPGLKQAESPYPHALYYASEDDVTDEVRATCFMLRVDYRPE